MFSLKVIMERLRSLVFAWKGLCYLVSKENSFKYQLFFSLLIIGIGFYFQIKASEWIAQLIMMALVLSVEGLNSSIELLADYIQPQYDSKIGKLKDVAAGAVLVTGIFALVVLLIIYIPYILALF